MYLRTKKSHGSQGYPKFRGPEHLKGTAITGSSILSIWLAVDLESSMSLKEGGKN